MFRRKEDFGIDRLVSGGLITNYYCTSSCAHCLYGCSPHWEKDYIDRETATENLEKIKSLGCDAIHVGGGESFLNLDGLKMVLEAARSVGVGIEYVETNSSWYRDMESACQILTSLKKRGLSTLLISMSPFHNEHIPFFKVKRVMEACRSVGMHVFPWIPDFYPEIDALDEKSTHAMFEYENRYGQDYLRELPNRYWVHFCGRALETFAPVFGITPHPEILSSNNRGCGELLDVSHFHFDLFGNYIPGLCSGLAIQRDDLGKAISQDRYPILNLLYQEGIGGLFDLVSDQYGFKPANGYMSKCHLCFALRRHLALERGVTSRELQPRGFYEHV